FLFLMPRPPRSTLFPSTTLFRSSVTPAGLLRQEGEQVVPGDDGRGLAVDRHEKGVDVGERLTGGRHRVVHADEGHGGAHVARERDRKSTRLNSSHVKISYAVFCL